MSVRNISAGAMRELFAEHSGAAMFACLTFNHPTMSAPERVVNNTQDVTFNGQVYTALPFEVTLPDDIEDRVPSLEIRIDNVERSLVELLRSVVTDLPSVQLEIVRVQDSPATLEIGPLSLSLLSSDINVDVVTLTVGHAIDILNEPGTKEIFNPKTSPGLFA